MFRSTAQGRLLIDEQARIDIERVAALHDRADALALLSEVAQPLGEGARREVQALYEQMVRYEQALSTALANEPDHPRIEDARRQLQTMQALRVEHFGDRAEALFGEEESQQQRLLDEAERVMRSRGISLEEAIGHAQALLMQSGGGGKKPPP